MGSVTREAKSRFLLNMHVSNVFAGHRIMEGHSKRDNILDFPNDCLKNRRKKKKNERVGQQQTNNGYLSWHCKTSMEETCTVGCTEVDEEYFSNTLGCYILEGKHVEKWPRRAGNTL
ncbi:hypothetical protein CDAR_426551 [Caerostris darwini]|uniref:Uncharacterized protein n=1 Tax=Caerostris darwini TaxID=1538125 RepID=A0AAV4N647_9ARAC|nr:hypothetical protein CDAR_426551 [Caerostris darwini]